MDRIFIIGLIVVAFALVQIFISNPIAQKLLPTKVGDSFGRKLSYSAAHRIVLVAVVAAVCGVLAILGVKP